jgi:hypothetical protein
MARRKTLEHMAPWLGLLGAGFGWGLAHQLGSNSVFDDCRTGTPLFIVAVSLVALLIALAGGYFSWDIWHRGKETEGRRFLGLLGTLLTAIASFAIVLQAVSSLIIPRCLA